MRLGSSTQKQCPEKSFDLPDLPMEICAQILKHLNPGDLAVASQVSKRWQTMTSYQPLWKRHVKEHCWAHPPALPSPDNTIDWKKVFYQTIRSETAALRRLNREIAKTVSKTPTMTVALRYGLVVITPDYTPFSYPVSQQLDADLRLKTKLKQSVAAAQSSKRRSIIKRMKQLLLK
jgi:hypothetical protein